MAKSTKIIAVDSGKYATKAYTKDGDKVNKIMFRTKMDKTDEEYTSLIDTYVVSFNGDSQRYMLGNGAEGVDYDKSKAKDIHRFAIYTAIARLANNGDNINLTVGCPLNVFNNVEERKAYQQFIMGSDNGKISMIINGDEFEFTLEKVNVCPESSGFIWGRMEEYSRKLIGVIDIGGLNTNACIYEKLAPVKSTAFTNNMGANILRNELKLALNQKFIDCNLQDWQMEDIIENGFIKSKPQESRAFISSFLANHIQNVLNDCKRKGWDLNNIDVIFVGGGSKLFKREILALLPSAEISKTAEWDNVEGFYVMGKALGKNDK